MWHASAGLGESNAVCVHSSCPLRVGVIACVRCAYRCSAAAGDSCTSSRGAGDAHNLVVFSQLLSSSRGLVGTASRGEGLRCAVSGGSEGLHDACVRMHRRLARPLLLQAPQLQML